MPRLHPSIKSVHGIAVLRTVVLLPVFRGVVCCPGTFGGLHCPSSIPAQAVNGSRHRLIIRFATIRNPDIAPAQAGCIVTDVFHFHDLYPHSDTFIKRNFIPVNPKKCAFRYGIVDFTTVETPRRFPAIPTTRHAINIIVNAVFNALYFKPIQAAVIGDAFAGHAIFLFSHYQHPPSRDTREYKQATRPQA